MVVRGVCQENVDVSQSFHLVAELVVLHARGAVLLGEATDVFEDAAANCAAFRLEATHSDDVRHRFAVEGVRVPQRNEVGTPARSQIPR